MRAAIITTALAVLALVPATASAGTITYQGDTLILQAAPGEANSLTFGGEQDGRLSISDSETHTFPATRCTQTDVGYAIQCDIPAKVKADLGDGNDRAVVDHMVQGNPLVEILGGAGADELKAIAGNSRLTLDGGAGNDVLRSEEGSDVLRGGADGDELIGGAGADTLEGGSGDDKLTGDVCGPAAPDVLDGGTGYDTLTDWGDCGPDSDRRPVTVSVNGVADDGRPGEGDDVRDLDVLRLFVPATVIGNDGVQAVEIYAAADREPSTIEGRGGADDLRGGSGRETIDGGAGDDRIEGGFNHDVLTGGPGRDVIYGDSTAGNCGGYGQSCTIPFGNDVINARDGSADQIDCGPGEDRAIVDAIDTVANCESVDGKPAAQAGAGGGTKPPGGTTSAAAGGATLTVKKPGRLRLTLRDGLGARLAGFRPGAVTIAVRIKGKVVAVGRVNVGSAGTATARVRFTRTARRTLIRKRSVRLAIRAGSLTTTMTVKR
jgi:hypothetical protein